MNHPPPMELLDLHRETAFVFDARGRMTHESAPDRSRGERFALQGCRDGSLVVIRDDVPDDTARELRRCVATEPPLAGVDAIPVHAHEYRSLLGVAPGVADLLGLVWTFPDSISVGADVHLVRSGTADGDGLLRRFAEVVPSSLHEIGFRSERDVWAPWCVALVDGRVASIAETVRTGPRGAEVGVDTDAGLRGRGLAAAATAGWSAHPELAGRTLFYSTSRDNASSRRVTERLGLDFLGPTFAVA